MMKEDTKQIGDVLKRKRLEMTLSLKEVENATSIRSTYLQSIEDGDLAKLISPVYAQGFIKQYASFLGMDGESLVREHPELFQRQHRDAEFSYGIGTLEVRGNPGAGVKWLPNIVWISAFTFVLFIAWLLARYLEVI